MVNIVRTYNLQKTYVYDADPWVVILVAAAFVLQSTYHRMKDKIPGQLVFGRDIIFPIEHVSDDKFIHNHKQAQIEKVVIHES